MKKFILGLTAGMVLATSTSVIADTVKEMIEVSVAPNDIYVNDTLIDTDSFLYNDTTYVPMRSITEAMDAEVLYDGDINRIDINTNDTADTADTSTNTDTTVETDTTDTSNMTISQENALDMAQTYLDIMSFSRQGLIDQLEHEGFSTEDATFGVDNSNADWFEQAELSAKEYLGIMSFSKQGLIDQLEYEGFTPEQAIHGVDSTGL